MYGFQYIVVKHFKQNCPHLQAIKLVLILRRPDQNEIEQKSCIC